MPCFYCMRTASDWAACVILRSKSHESVDLSQTVLSGNNYSGVAFANCSVKWFKLPYKGSIIVVVFAHRTHSMLFKTNLYAEPSKLLHSSCTLLNYILTLCAVFKR